MPEMLAGLGLLILVAGLPAASMILSSRRQRLIVGSIGLFIGVVCQLIGSDVHPEVIVASVIGYVAAMAALIAEIVNWCFRKLGGYVRASLARPAANATDKS